MSGARDRITNSFLQTQHLLGPLSGLQEPHSLGLRSLGAGLSRKGGGCSDASGIGIAGGVRPGLGGDLMSMAFSPVLCCYHALRQLEADGTLLLHLRQLEMSSVIGSVPGGQNCPG